MHVIQDDPSQYKSDCLAYPYKMHPIASRVDLLPRKRRRINGTDNMERRQGGNKKNIYI